MSDPSQLVRALADGAFRSGEDLAAGCGISRAAIWKQIERLRHHYGLDVQALPGRGYRLATPLELLDEDLIVGDLSPQSRFLLQHLELLFEVDSTNQYLLDAWSRGAAAGWVCSAEFQSAGRGRRGRAWVSPLGGALYLSVAWEYPLGPARLSGLSLAAGLAAARALRRLGVRRLGLKWPNDLLWGQRKLGGLLLEVRGEQDGPTRLVLGIGVNLRIPADQGEAIDQPWVDLHEILGQDQPPSRNHLCAAFLDELLPTLLRFEHEGLAPHLEEWLGYDVHYGRPVVLHQGGRAIEGIHRGIDPSGALILEQDGERRLMYGGEVSLRG
jgi:BirA family transcriptional regulator, biotin operon repressor / biotin---[acetyl-CoA-carboxylase] ligase